MSTHREERDFTSFAPVRFGIQVYNPRGKTAFDKLLPLCQVAPAVEPIFAEAYP